MSIIVVENVLSVFRLRSVSESGMSPRSSGSAGSSGDRSTLEARNFSRTSSGIFCRICHDGEGAEALISPCQCSGEERGGGYDMESEPKCLYLPVSVEVKEGGMEKELKR